MPNGSFEEYEECPYGLGQVSLVLGWDSVLNSVDYYNVCSDLVGVPNNTESYQEAFDGSGYIGLYIYPNPTDVLYREIVGTNLNEPMIPGTTYYFSFRLNKADKSTNQKASNNLGVKFLNGPIVESELLVDNWSHWKIDTICYDTAHWNLIKGSFIADAEYDMLCIGNFYDNESTLTDGPGTIWDKHAYYNIDDFRLSLDSSYAWPTDIDESNLIPLTSLAPTVCFDGLVRIASSGLFDVMIFSSNGQVMLSSTRCFRESQIDISARAKGLYLFVVMDEKGNKFLFKVLNN